MDEVIAIDVKVTNNFNIASDIIWPDISVKNKKTIEKDLSIAFLSDIHVGSKHFKDKEFERMLKWLNGGESGKSIAEKIGYLLIAGDIADGIGIYPRQEQDLLIKDIYEQYALFQKFLDIIPDHIQIFITPGNHDAVRHAEPQPALEKDLIPENDRIHSLSNPTHLEIEGLKTLMYHGTSMESLVTDIPGLSFARPEEVAVEYLKRRTLCPIYDKNEIAPENRDYLFVDEVDIFQTAHVHKNGYTEYRGTVVLNAGTWLDKTTKWQLRRGFTPTPGILPIYNMKEGRITHIDFNSSELRIF
jgi:DNA polymerase II small subunit